MVKHITPIKMHRERHDNIRKEGEGQIFKILRVARIGGEYLEEKRERRECDDENEPAERRHEELSRGRHRSEISRDIKHISEKEKAGNQVEDTNRIVATDISGQPFA